MLVSERPVSNVLGKCSASSEPPPWKLDILQFDGIPANAGPIRVNPVTARSNWWLNESRILNISPRASHIYFHPRRDDHK